MKSHELEMMLRGQPVTFEFKVSGPDPSVGLFGWTIESYRVIGEDGEVLDWELDGDEMDVIQPQVDDYMHGWISDDYD